MQIEQGRDCGGLGKVFERPCPECRGVGRVTKRRVLKVRIPPGVKEGTRLRVIGEKEHEHLLVRILSGPIDSPLVRWVATILFAAAICLLVYFLAQG